MSLYLLSHDWQVEDVEDGIVVRISRRDLDEETQGHLADELFELSHESGMAKLYLDFGDLNSLTPVTIEQIYAVNRRLRRGGGELVLCGLQPSVQQLLRSHKRAEVEAVHAELASC